MCTTVPRSNDCCCLQSLAKDYGLDTGMTDADKIAVGAVGVGVTAIAAAGLYFLFGRSKEKKRDC